MRRPPSSVLTPTAAVRYPAISLGPLTCIDPAHSARAGGVRSPREGIPNIRVAAEASCLPPRRPIYDSEQTPRRAINLILKYQRQCAPSLGFTSVAPIATPSCPRLAPASTSLCYR